MPVPCHGPVSVASLLLFKLAGLHGGRMGCTSVTTNEVGGVDFLPVFSGCLSLVSVLSYVGVQGEMPT